MNLRLLTGCVLVCTAVLTNAQSIAKSYKAASQGNPISPGVFCADPTALEFDGRVYVYGSNDHQQFIANGKKDSNGYGAIKSLVVFSSDDMVNWTFHGTIDVGKICSSWGWRFAASWAPSVTWRVNEQGENEFFLYFANSVGKRRHAQGQLTLGAVEVAPQKAAHRQQHTRRQPVQLDFRPRGGHR